MKPAFIQYRKLNTENNYEIYSDNGNAFDLRGAPVTNISPAQLKFGTTVNVDDDAKKIFIIPKVYDFITSGINQEFSGLKFLPTGVLNSFPVYSDKNQKYIIWRNTGISRWVLTNTSSANNIFAPSFIKSNTGNSITGVYSGSGYNGTITINNIDNKLRVYNTPGISGFAGTYTSGTFTIQGSSIFGFQNDQNSRFYIIKNNSPSVWKAVEWPVINGSFSLLGTWYHAEDSGQYPPVTGWRGGDIPQMFPPSIPNGAPFPVVGPYLLKSLDLLEMNFGTCPGNTLIYPEYIYKAYSQDPDINKIYFYSGGALSSSGTSDLFPDNVSLSDMFPDLYNTYFDKQFFYSDYKNNNIYFLFKTYAKSAYEIVDLWYIVKSPSSYNSSGYYYWASQDNYITGDRNNYFNSARKIYKPAGTQINNLRDITIDIHEDSLNKESPYEKDFNLQNFSGELLIKGSQLPVADINDPNLVVADFREKVRELLFENETFTENDLIQVLYLVEGAALAGDPTAALWMGRSRLGQLPSLNGQLPPDRVRAAAWFLVAIANEGRAEVGEAPGYDARGELEALALSPAELSAAREEADILRARPKKPPHINNFYKLQKIDSGKFNGLTGVSGQFFTFASPKFNISGVTCGNQAFTLNPSTGILNGSGRLQFVRATEGFQYEVQFTRNLLSGWNTTGITLTPSLSQSNVPSGFIREEFYLPLSELSNGNLFFRMSGTPAIWKILNSDYSFTNFKNCQSNSNILPYSYVGTPLLTNYTFLPVSYEIIPVYKHNELIDNRKMLKLDSQYNYSEISGIFNLNTGQSFVFQFFNEQPITGIIVEKSGENIFVYTKNNSMFDIITNNGVTRMNIENKSKNLTYYVFRSGSSSSVSKLSYDLCNIHCFIE